jgi:tetratricopeptide (TPR) repeat protein
MAVPDFVQSWFGSGPLAAWLFYGIAIAILVMLLSSFWLGLGPVPRRRRAYKRAGQLLSQGSWQEALSIAGDLQHRSRNSPRWQRVLARFEGECHQAAGAELLGEKKYEASLERFFKAARALNLNDADLRGQVIAAMLAEVRRLVATQLERDTDAIHKLIGRVLLILSPCPEALFWQGLCHIREGKTELARNSLLQARGPDPEPRGTAGYIDPPLYLGALLLREGRTDEALRYLSEANRLDANCPFVTWQLGTAMLAAGGDTQIAIRALQRALGVRGLQQWVHSPQRAWVEGFPEKRSFVRRLAAKQAFSCPLFGNNVSVIIRQGQITLGQALYRLGNFEESSKVFNQLLQDSAPSLPVLRGLGLALARLDRFDQAFKHLRAAHEMEEPKNFLTAGYLALCGAKGKPTQPEDKARNVHWAVRLVAKFDVQRNPEWANLLNRIFAEARSAELPVAVEDQVRLCDVLVSVDATDPLAAEAFGQLAATLARQSKDEGGRMKDEKNSSFILHPSSFLMSNGIRPEYAWLFCRAAQEHGSTAERVLDLFALTFATEAEARGFYAQRQWDFDEMEYAYLERCAALAPGAFPQALEADAADRGEKLLLGRSQLLEELKDQEGALQAAEVFLKLAPRNPPAHDRLAYLYHRTGNLDKVVELLERWYKLAQDDPLPLLRLAVVEQQRGNGARRAAIINRALALAPGSLRAEVAFLGARLALQDWLHGPAQAAAEASRNGENLAAGSLVPADQGKQVIDLLDECLQADPNHEAGLWCKAAVCSILDRAEDLTALASAMGRLEQGTDRDDARFYFLAAVCHLAARDYPRVLESAARAERKDPALALECACLKGWAAYLMQDGATATGLLQGPAKDTAAAQAHAQALLARIAFEQGAAGEAIGWWKSLDPARRKEWGLDEPLRSTIFVSALQSLHQNRFAEAADKIREAGKLGLRDRRIGPLLALALLKAGQRLLYGALGR